MPPGSLIHVGKKKKHTPKITIFDYNEESFTEKVAKKVEECFPFKERATVTWINIDGVHDSEIIEKLGKHFRFHPLLLEDIMNTEQRPKIDDFGDYLFVVAKMLQYNEQKDQIVEEQISLILGSNFVISFQEQEGDIFDPIRERIRQKKGRVRTMWSDYLVYALMDVIIDNYFIVLEKLGEKIEDVEEELLVNPSKQTLQDTHALKRKMISLRRASWPLRDVISGMQRTGSVLIKKPTAIYLKDVYDHTVQVIDTIETYRDIISSMLDIYLSGISNKLNEVMKVLTIIGTIFIPLTFITGIHGMNFKFMPELEWKYGYFATLGVMLVIGLLMLLYFKRKRWI